MTKLKTSLNSAHIKESDIQKEILDWLKTLPEVIAWKHHIGHVKVGSGRAKNPASGLPDILGIYTLDMENVKLGITLGIEVKAPGKKVKEGSKQAEWLEVIKDRGGIAFEADSLEICKERLYYQLAVKKGKSIDLKLKS